MRKCDDRTSIQPVGRAMSVEHWRRRKRSLALPAIALIAAAGLVRADPPTDGLIGYWTGNHTAEDSSPIANHGTFSGSYVDGGPFGHAAFALATAKVSIPDIPAYDFENLPGWTVGFWFNINGRSVYQGNGVFLGQDEGPDHRRKWFIDYGYTVFNSATTTFVLHMNDENQERIFLESCSVSPIPPGWAQLTVSVDNVARIVSFYLNGHAIGVRGLPAYKLRPASPLWFGYAEPGLSYSGLLNNVVIYNRALSADEAAQLFAGGCPGDFNADGFVNGDDYDAFAGSFDAGAPSADVNGDGFVNGDDFDVFALAFEGGC